MLVYPKHGDLTFLQEDMIMFKKCLYLISFVFVLGVMAPFCLATIGPITSVMADNPDGTIPYNLLSITVGDYTVNADYLVVGTTTHPRHPGHRRRER